MIFNKFAKWVQTITIGPSLDFASLQIPSINMDNNLGIKKWINIKNIKNWIAAGINADIKRYIYSFCKFS